MQIFKFISLLVFFSLIISFCAMAGEGYKKGDIAPTISLKDMSDKAVDTKNYKGQVLYLVFWTSWCGGCMQEIPEVNEIYKTYKSNKSFKLFSVNLQDPKEDAQKAISDKKITYPVLLDTDGKVSEKYGIQYIPLNVIINSKGVIVFRQEGAIKFEDMKKIIDKCLGEVK